MGAFNMRRVIEALSGVEIPQRCETKSGTVKEKDLLQPSGMLLLLAIANRQPDETKDFPESDAHCYGDLDTLAKFAHVDRSTVDRYRKRLCDAGLISYWRNKKFRDFQHPDKMRVFANVYKLNWPRILSYRGVAQGDSKVAQCDSDVAQGDSKVAQGDSKVAQRDLKVAQCDSKVAQCDTKRKERIDKSSSSSSSSKMAAATSATAADDAEIVKFGRSYLNHIAIAAGLTSAEKAQIDVRALGRHTVGKTPGVVFDTINTTISTSTGPRKDNFPFWIKILISKLKNIPLPDAPIPYEEAQKAFGVQRKPCLDDLLKQTEFTSEEFLTLRDIYWEDFCSRVGLDKLDESRRAELNNLYNKVCARNPLHPKWTLEKFSDDFLFNHKGGGTTTIADIVNDLTIDGIYDLAKGTLKEMLGGAE